MSGVSDSLDAGMGVSPPWMRMIIVCSVLALAWTVFARVLGPCDLWDQTQPKTVGYTTDMIANGRWILPVELGQHPATKPVLYNWLAVPTVKLLGFASELGHKFPSVAALCFCWLALVRLGRWMDDSPGQSRGLVGWLAGMVFAANYTMFKLGYLARPDMLLTLWLVLGWMACTGIYAGARRDDSGAGAAGRRRMLALGLWGCVGLAALTKGPAAVTLVAYAVIAAKLVAGRWRAVSLTCWQWGIPLCLVMVGAWVYGVWRVDAEHLRSELWMEEIWGRVMGTGQKGTHEGPMALITDAPNMTVYYFVRFFPWSVLSVFGLIAIWRRGSPRNLREPGGPRKWREMGESGSFLQGAAVFLIIIIVAYTLSAGKRADYIAAAFAPGALLAAWWLVREGPRIAVRLPWLAPACAAMTLIVLTVNNEREPTAPVRGFGDEITDFARRASAAMESEDLDVEFCWSGLTHLQAMMGYSRADGTRAVRDMKSGDEPIWVVAGMEMTEPADFGVWLISKREGLVAEPILRSAELPRIDVWQKRMTLYRVRPAGVGDTQP